MKYVLYVLVLLSFSACNNSSKTEEVAVHDSSVAVIKADTSSRYIHTFSDTVLQSRITGALLRLPFVIKSSNYIDSFSNHKHSIAFIMDDPAANETEIQVQAGYNGDERFETYYRFFVDPKTLEIKVYDPLQDRKLTVPEFIKAQ